jgi:hypothetical protein
MLRSVRGNADAMLLVRETLEEASVGLGDFIDWRSQFFNWRRCTRVTFFATGPVMKTVGLRQHFGSANGDPPGGITASIACTNPRVLIWSANILKIPDDNGKAACGGPLFCD